MSDPLKSFAGLKRGQKFMVVANSNSHNYPMDTALTLNRDGVRTTGMSNCAVEVPGGNNLMASDCVLLAMSLESIKLELVNIGKKYKAESDELKSKIDFCEKNGLDTFDEDFYKVHSALKALDSKATLIEKTKVITALLK